MTFTTTAPLPSWTALTFYAGGFGYPRPHPTTVGPRSPLNLPSIDNYATYLNIGPLKNFHELTGDSLAFWKTYTPIPITTNGGRPAIPRNFDDRCKTATMVWAVLLMPKIASAHGISTKPLKAKAPPP